MGAIVAKNFLTACVPGERMLHTRFGSTTLKSAIESVR